MIGIPLGLLYANMGEWLVHKHVLHGAGRDKKSFWAFHWHEHHRESRRNGHYDEHYETPPFETRPDGTLSSQGKEAAGLIGAAILHAPLFPVAPFFTATVWYSMARYYRVHKRAHLDPEWARENLSWHYDHHMGPNQDANWCVSRPWFDELMGTREPYAFTEREARDIERKRRREEARQARAAAKASVDRPASDVDREAA